MVEPNVLITPEMQVNLQIEAECFKSLVRFREVHLAGEKDVPSAEFHYRWSDILLNGREHYAIEGFRESGKDQVVFSEQPHARNDLSAQLPVVHYDGRRKQAGYGI